MKTSHKTLILLAAVILLTALIIYIPTLKSGFLWDDIQLISHPLRMGGNSYAFFFGSGLFYRPFLHLSMAFDYGIWHLNAVGFHATNIVLHMLNSLLVFTVAVLLIKNHGVANVPGVETKNQWRKMLPPFLAALFFALHPIHTESVAWISGRTDILSTFFFLLSFVSYLTYEKDRRIRSLIISSLFFLFALFSKENAMSFILVVLAYGIITKMPGKRIMTSLAAFVSVIIIYFLFRQGGVITMMLASPGSQEAFFGSGLTAERIAYLVVQGTGYYFEKLILPFNLSLLPEVPDKSFYVLFFVLPLVAGGLAYFSGRRLEAFCLIWIIVTLLPSLSLLFSRITPLGERYLYLPSVGFCIILAAGVTQVKDKRFSLAMISAILISYSVSEYVRLDAWKDEAALWEDTIRKTPASATAHANYGSALIERKELDRGKSELFIALRQKVSPQQASSIYDLLGKAEMRGNNYREAKEYFIKSLSANSANASALNSLGLLYIKLYESANSETTKKEFLDKSVASLERAAALSPNYLAPKLNLGICYYNKREFARAEGYLYSVIESDPQTELSVQAFQLLMAIEFAKNRALKHAS